MAKLVVYVPFSSRNDSDIRVNAEELRTAPFTDFTSVRIVYKGDETKSTNRVEAGDIVVVHAHGSDADTKAYDNTRGGRPMKMSDLRLQLETLRAHWGSKIYFAICFSSMTGHIADVWMGNYGSHQRVYGASGIMQGGLIYATRTSIRSSIFDYNNAQLSEL